jgi:hypothetical protein
LTEAVARRLDLRSATVDIELPLADGRSAAAVRRSGAVLQEETLETDRLRLRVKLSQGALGNLRRALGNVASFELVDGGQLSELALPEDPARERA